MNSVTCMLHVVLTCMSILHAHIMQNYMHVACTFRKQACHMNLSCMLHAQHFEQGSDERYVYRAGT